MLPLEMFASPIHITSDAMEIQTLSTNMQMRFYHNACVDGDEFSLSANHIQIAIVNGARQVSSTLNLSVIEEIHATGNATFEQASYAGRANKISIYPAKKLIVLEGNAEIENEKSGIIYGQTLILDLENKKIRSESSEFERSTISINDISKFKSNNILIK